MRPEELSSDLLDVLSGVCYVVAADRTVQSIGPTNWNRFCAESRTSDLGVDRVLGRSLFDFIEGEEVKATIHAVLDRLDRGDVAEWVMPYRCDTPRLKRNMRLSVSPIVEDGKVAGYLFQSVMLDQETRPPVDLFEVDSMASRMADLKGRTFVLMCNWCQRVKLRDDPERPFVEGHEYYRRGGSPSVAVFHTICPDCRVREREGFVPRKR